jgi:hypothetical protein
MEIMGVKLMKLARKTAENISPVDLSVSFDR